MKSVLLPLFICVTISQSVFARTWTSADGKRTFEGDFRSYNRETGMVVVVKGGREISFQQSMLSEADQKFVESKLPPVEEPIAPGFGSWGTILKDTWEKEKPPAFGGIVILDGKIGNPEAYGMRKFGGSKEVTPDDKWHIGSCTKSMTATLVATFVEEGKVTWETTVQELLGKEIDIAEHFQKLTFYMLLTNRSGLPEHIPGPIWSRAWAANGGKNIIKMRLEFLEEMLNLEASSAPGTKYEYSNTNFITAGAMLEALTGDSWEDLMQERIFKPLGMESAGFGAPATGDKEDQPWPHSDSKTLVTRSTDNPRMLGPAGTVHASLIDLAKYVRMHLLKQTGRVIQKEETFDLLHKPVANNNGYACGWFAANRGWANGIALNHHGSNTMNYTIFWVAPERKFAAIVVTNTGQDGTRKVCDDAITKGFGHFLK